MQTQVQEVKKVYCATCKITICYEGKAVSVVCWKCGNSIRVQK